MDAFLVALNRRVDVGLLNFEKAFLVRGFGVQDVDDVAGLIRLG